MFKNINIIFIIFGGIFYVVVKYYLDLNKCILILGYYIYYNVYNILLIMFKFKYGNDC